MSNCAKRYEGQWSDLPPELVSDIADRLGTDELQSFRTVCKAWNSASYTAVAKVEPAPDIKPWFLLYGITNNELNKDSDLQSQLLVKKSGEKYPICLPQLDGTTTCLASNQGWLLLFQPGGSMFFFRPFVPMKIDLPKFPASELSDHVAAFSSPPTSQDCMVCVMSRKSDGEFELNVLHRGAKEWTQHKYDRPIDTIKCAAYRNGEFYFLDSKSGYITFAKDLSWNRDYLVEVSNEVTECRPSPDYFYTEDSYFQTKDMKKKLGLADDASISTCGTLKQYHGLPQFVFNETISSNRVQEPESRQFKGVWIYPKMFYQTTLKDEIWWTFLPALIKPGLRKTGSLVGFRSPLLPV